MSKCFAFRFLTLFVIILTWMSGEKKSQKILKLIWNREGKASCTIGQKMF
jgi:hypothetical protein